MTQLAHAAMARRFSPAGPRVAVSRAVGAILIYAAVASSSSTTAPDTGSLSVTITEPARVSTTVTVTGPGSYSKTLAATQTLTGLATGNYTITAGTAMTVDSIVSIAYAGTVTGSPAAVIANTTAKATVTYSAPWSSSGVLWVANQLGNNVTAFSAAQLSSTGAPTPVVSLGNGAGNSVVQDATALAIDRTGGIWIANGTDTLYYYSASAASHSTNAAATVKLVSSALQEPQALAFDGQGNLWVADQGSGKLDEFSASQLLASTAVSPTVVVSSVLGSINRPFSMAFDGHGDLWVASYGDSSVVGFSPSQLAASGAPVPYAGLSGSKGITNCLTIAFDAQGDLWVATLTDTLAEFTPNGLTSVGAPSPAVVITTPAIELAEGLAFDNSGALWMADNQRNVLVRYLPAQLVASGSPTPAVTISAKSGSLVLPAWLAFSPHGMGLPIN